MTTKSIDSPLPPGEGPGVRAQAQCPAMHELLPLSTPVERGLGGEV
jgi:hypothetical protein